MEDLLMQLQYCTVPELLVIEARIKELLAIKDKQQKLINQLWSR